MPLIFCGACVRPSTKILPCSAFLRKSILNLGMKFIPNIFSNSDNLIWFIINNFDKQISYLNNNFFYISKKCNNVDENKNFNNKNKNIEKNNLI